MNNVFSNSSPLHQAESKELEDTRLGTVLVNALSCRYESADEVIEHVKHAALKIGIIVVNDDEVDIDDKWENVFEVRGKQLCFRAKD